MNPNEACEFEVIVKMNAPHSALIDRLIVDDEYIIEQILMSIYSILEKRVSLLKSRMSGSESKRGV